MEPAKPTLKLVPHSIFVNSTSLAQPPGLPLETASFQVKTLAAEALLGDALCLCADVSRPTAHDSHPANELGP